MQLDHETKKAVREIGDAINRAVEKSARVAEAVEALRELGYEPELSLKLEIGLRELGGADDAADETDHPEDIELDLTEDDVRTLRRMKIKF